MQQQQTERHFQRASNHNRYGELMAILVTERHFQRASNHNHPPSAVLFFALKGIFKEHQTLVNLILRANLTSSLVGQK